jgi:hypothetical protein
MDNPGQLGKGRVRLVESAPLKPERTVRERWQASPVPLAVFAHRQSREKELGGQARLETVPSRIK